MQIKASNLTLVGGATCLDFANTRDWNDRETPSDFFTDYHALLGWALQMDLLTQRQAERLADASRRKIQEALMVLKHARAVREAIYRIFFAIANEQEIPPAELDFFNETWRKALGRLQVQKDRKIFQWKWIGMEEELDSVLWPVLHSAAELLISEKLPRVKDCGGCRWLFLDTTRGGRRRWCDMRICGNREKARRHYSRTRELQVRPERKNYRSS
jgi:predicted RNA-binding Zn ribbon-like protein